MKKILSIAGTRPQLIKQAALYRVCTKEVDFRMTYTFQHYDDTLGKQIADDLQLPPLSEIHSRATLLTGEPRLAIMIEQLSAAIETINPSIVLVMGDTDTTLAGAIAANRKKKCLVHVEAGERSFNFNMPEEWNRTITDSLSDVLFCATDKAADLLKKEMPYKQILVTGDVMKDIFLQTHTTPPDLNTPYFYASLHRLYNRENPAVFRSILNNLNALNHPVIFTLHPSTGKAMRQSNILPEEFSNIQFIPPPPYSANLSYIRSARHVYTDSGGMQKECYWSKTPCTTIRPETEWMETLTGNWNRLVYDDLDELKNTPEVDKEAYNESLYGDGKAAQRIMDYLSCY